MAEFFKRLDDPSFHVKFNLVMLVVWTLLLVPTMLLWQESIPWIVFMSWYANTVGHWSAFTSSKTEREMVDNE